MRHVSHSSVIVLTNLKRFVMHVVLLNWHSANGWTSVGGGMEGVQEGSDSGDETHKHSVLCEYCSDCLIEATKGLNQHLCAL